jgi:L-amino acid N-acyltransferase YncA
MDFLIRKYLDTDAEAVRKIINTSILHTTHNYDYYPKTLEEVQKLFSEKIKDGFPVLVGEVNGEVVGYATYGKFRAKPGYSHSIEHSIYLNEKAQGKGLGSKLMSQLIETAKLQGYHIMIAGMDSENLSSYRFHQKMGFIETARMPEVSFKFGKWLTLVFMQLRLS